MKVFTVSLLVLLLTGCGVLGLDRYAGVEIDTVRKSILVANAEVRGANLLLKEVIRSRTISAEDAQKALDGLQEAKDLLQSALHAVDVLGDVAEGQGHLDRAILGLDLVMAILAPATAPPQASLDIDFKEAA